MEEIKTIHDLKEMDLVLRRDGKICWILRNEFTHELQSFSYNLWGQQTMHNYSDDFIYGKNRKDYQGSELDKQYDIVAVYRPRSMWKVLEIMYVYVVAVRENDRDRIEEIIKNVDWIYVNKEEKE